MTWGFPGGTNGKELPANTRLKRCRFHPWIRKIPQRRAWQPTPGILAWRILWTQEPGGLQSIGYQRVRHDWSNVACMHTMSIIPPPPISQARTTSYGHVEMPGKLAMMIRLCVEKDFSHDWQTLKVLKECWS